jgi:DNA-binding CsgD family transcriptional regulator
MDVQLDTIESWSAHAHVAASRGLPATQPTVSRSAPSLGLAELWSALSRGEYRIQENAYVDDRCIARIRRALRPMPLKRRRVETLRRSLLGESQKSIAIDLGLAASSIAGACGDCVVATGGGQRGSRPAVLLVMAAHAAFGYRVPARSSAGDGPAFGELLELSCPRPDSILKERLTPKEYEVVRLFVEGESHSSIAVRCDSSSRTIANHIGSVFRKLKVSGRAELLSRLIREQWAP